MKINNNISAVIANKQLLRTEGRMAETMERLSSGLKINHAKDNPAGMAISNKMRAQIAGLDRASANASDGISALNIADGSLNETTNMLQRMRELAVQAANDTNSLEEKEAIQKEMDALKSEITRISRDTEYNTLPLLDGSLDTRIYSEKATRIQVSDFVKPGDYVVDITSAATKASAGTTTGVDYTSETPIDVEGTVSLNGHLVNISAEDTYANVYEKLREGAELGEMEANRDDAGKVTFTSAGYGSDAAAEIICSDAALAKALGFTNYTEKVDGTCAVASTAGEDAKLAMVVGDTTTAAGEDVESKFTNTATYTTDGNKITITDKDGFTMSFLVEADHTGKVDFEVTDIGTMTLHIGSNEDQNIEVRIPDISAESLYIDDIDVRTIHGAGNAIIKIDAAIAQVSEARSKIGAYTNRLEYSVSGLDAFEENTTAALSRLADADMAEEMTEYTQQMVLDQSAISVLTQANEMPQQVLQLLS